MDVFDRMGNVGHPDEEYLERYVMKLCTDREKREMEAHLQICEHCKTRFHQAEEWVALMKMAVPLGPKSSRASPGGWRVSMQKIFSRPMVAVSYATVVLALCATPAVLLLSDRFAGEETVVLAATRGGADSGPQTASSRNRLRLKIDTNGLEGPLEAQVVDASGVTVSTGALAAGRPELVLAHKLEPGSYWVRVNSGLDHRTLRETGLRVQ